MGAYSSTRETEFIPLAAWELNEKNNTANKRVIITVFTNFFR